ncbi:MAG: thioredoxin family protein [Bacteroides sp.]|nr:thioredoxin family protein [Bacteroides sp.]
MKKLILMSLAAVAMTLPACSNSKQEPKNIEVEVVSDAEITTMENDKVLKSSKGHPMLADFSAEWCPPCRQMKPIFRKLKNEYEGKIDLVTIDVDKNPELAERYNVTSIPTFVYISPSGKELYRNVGLQTEVIIRSDILKYLSE